MAACRRSSSRRHSSSVTGPRRGPVWTVSPHRGQFTSSSGSGTGTATAHTGQVSVSAAPTDAMPAAAPLSGIGNVFRLEPAQQLGALLTRAADPAR
jgi:hypothetical protein